MAAQNSPFVTATATASGVPYFADQYGQPILVRGYVLWGLLMNAGRWGGTWQGDLENAVTALKTLRVNVLYTKPLGDTVNGGATDDGKTWDGLVPFTGGNPATFNNTFWQRSDYLFDLCAAAGITVFFNLAYSTDLDVAALAGFTTAQFQSYGTSLGARYKNRPNLVWMIGGDYFDNQATELTAMFTSIAGQGDSHLVGVENYAESTSRRDIRNNGVQTTGTNVADLNFVYSYNVTYWGIEYAANESSPIPAVWGDGHFDQGSTDRKVMRDLLWWTLSSGGQGNVYGDEGTWGWTSSALTNMTSNTYAATDQPRIWDLFAGLRGWHLLRPDTDNSLVTAGRGTKADYVTTSGGSGGSYDNTDTQSGYVTASVTPSGRLAVIYFPVDQTITVNAAEMAAGYTARWVDPVSGASASTSTGSSYSPTGNNSIGGPDWLLILEA